MHRLYIPDNLNLVPMLQNIGRHKWSKNFLDHYYYIISTIHYLRMTNKTYNNNSFVRINQARIRTMINKRHCKAFFHDLIDLKIIECDYKGKPGVRSYGYRFTEPYRNSKMKIKFVLDFLLAQKIVNLKYDRVEQIETLEPHLITLYKFLERTEVDYPATNRHITNSYSNDTAKYNQRFLALDMIHAKDFYFKRGKLGNRLFTNISSFPKDMRKFLIVKDSFTDQQIQLTEIDIKNSQPLFLLVYLLKKHKNNIPIAELARYQKIVENGFYEWFMKKLKISISDREKVKKDVYKKLLFNKHHKKNPTVYEVVFKHDFPTIFKIITSIKSKHGHAKLSHLMQKVEAIFILDLIAKQYTQQFPMGYLVTIHDSIIVKSNHAQIYADKIRDELKSRYGVNVTLHVNPVNSIKVDQSIIDAQTQKDLNSIKLPPINRRETIFKNQLNKWKKN